MDSGEAKIETRLDAYFLTHCSLNPEVSRTNVSVETLFN
jgi:hypothetical protein